MPFLAYIAIILVSLGGILFELNWLTSPKLETKPAVQASAAAPQPKVAAATAAPAKEPLNEDVTEPKADGPRNVAPTVTKVPGGAIAAKPAQTAETQPAPTPMTATPASKTTQPQSSEPPPQQAVPVAPPANANSTTAAAALSPVETNGTGAADFKREFTNDAKPGEQNASTATFTPAAAATSNNKCDIAACSAAYQSFRASDCTYQPLDGNARKVCDRTQGGAQQAAAQPSSQPSREHNTARAEVSRKQSKDAGLRAFEREVRRITASEANLDPGYDRGGRSQVIVIDRGDWQERGW